MGTAKALLLRLFGENLTSATNFFWFFSVLTSHLLAFMPNYLLRRLGRLWLLALPVMLLFSSCTTSKYYQQRTLFRLTDSQGRQLDSTKLRIAVNRSERNYVIQPNDILDVRVNTNKGERILDPNGELQFGQPSGGLPSRSSAPAGGQNSGGARSGGTRNTGQGAGASASGSEFLVQADGTVVLPMVGRMRLSGLSLLQADSVLAIRFNEYYKETFVSTRVANNRVVVLGAAGGQVVSLTNDNMNLVEVLALAGGLDGGGQGGGGGGGQGGFYRYGGKANNIRIIRGDLKNPRVQQVDLTTLDGMRRANLQIEPNDIIYIEPVHRPVLETLTDAAPIISFATLTLTTTLFLINLFK